MRSATDSIRSSRVGSAQWMSSIEDDERLRVGEVLQHPAERPDELLLGRGRLETDEAGEAAGDRGRLGQTGDERVDPLALPSRRSSPSSMPAACRTISATGQ